MTIHSDEALVPPYDLPDPLRFADGSPVTTVTDWGVRRREITDLFATHVYGQTRAIEVDGVGSIAEPDSPALDGSAARRQTYLTVPVNGATLQLALLSYFPARSTGPHPVIVVPNFRGNHTINVDAAICISERARRDLPELASERGVMAHRFPLQAIVGRGFGLVTFYYGDVIADVAGLGDGAHPLFPRGASGRSASEWGAIGAWAWGIQRVVDHLWTDVRVDNDRIIVAGHSRLGKAALWAAAQDERVAAVFANNSGCTGAAIARRRFGETVAAINALFPHWFCLDYHAYAEREHELPIDQHQLIAAIAPRPVYVASASEDLWADPHGEFLGALHASPVYRLLGVEGLTIDDWPPRGAPSTGRIGYHLRAGGHELLTADWSQFLDFIELRLPARDEM